MAMSLGDTFRFRVEDLGLGLETYIRMAAKQVRVPCMGQAQDLQYRLVSRVIWPKLQAFRDHKFGLLFSGKFERSRMRFGDLC
jgi:hypothetical protein